MTAVRWTPEQLAAYRTRATRSDAGECRKEAVVAAGRPSETAMRPHTRRNVFGAGAPAGMMRIELPWPPSGNHATRHAGGAHYSTKRHRAYRATVAQTVLVAGVFARCDVSRDIDRDRPVTLACATPSRAVGRNGSKPFWNTALAGCGATFDGRLILRATFHPPDRRRRDLDNLAKVLLDALQHAGLFADDGAIDVLELRRGSPASGGSVTVELGTCSASRGAAAIPLHSVGKRGQP